jgi:hyperosmotically inducible protein
MINLNKFVMTVTVAALSLGSTQLFALTDTEINDKVKSKISSDQTTANSDINVSTRDGIVTLRGNLQTEAEADAAIEDANSVTGVKDVDSDYLMVKDSSQPYKDAYITAKVKGSFVREKLFDDSPIAVTTIHVETQNGVVFLTGTVNTESQAATAVKLAKEIKGVSDVQSKLVIKP